MVQIQPQSQHRSPRPRAATSADPCSKVRRVLVSDPRPLLSRGALILLEFMPYRSTRTFTKVLRSAVPNAEKTISP